MAKKTPRYGVIISITLVLIVIGGLYLSTQQRHPAHDAATSYPTLTEEEGNRFSEGKVNTYEVNGSRMVVTDFADQTLAETGDYYEAAALAITSEIADTLGLEIVSTPEPVGGGGDCEGIDRTRTDAFYGGVAAFGYGLHTLDENAWQQASELIIERAAELGYKEVETFTNGAGNPHMVIRHESGSGTITWSQALAANLSISSPCLKMQPIEHSEK